MRVDFDDPTTNMHDVAPQQSLNQSPEVTDDAGSTNQLTTKVYSCMQSNNNDKSNLNIVNIYEVMIKVGIRKRSWSRRWTQTKYKKLCWLTFN